MSARRKLVGCFAQRRVSLSRACALLKISRRRLKYVSGKNEQELVMEVKELARIHVRYGYRHLCKMLNRRRQAGGQERVNLKRVRRLCRMHGLVLRQKRRRKRRGIGVGLPCAAEYPNHVWAYDFVEDRTETGRKLRILTVVDEFTRRSLEVEVEHRMNAKFVGGVLLRLFAEHGTPAYIRSDNGPEFIARFLMSVLRVHGVEARHIDPGSPWQNGIDERFNGTLRDECLNLETFHGRDQARAVTKLFARFYNQGRPHSSLGDRTPEEFYQQWKRNNDDGCAGGEEKLGLRPKPQDLTLCASNGREAEGSGPTARDDRPDDRRMVHVGAPVASQQSRILRVDESSVAESREAGTFPVLEQHLGPKV